MENNLIDIVKALVKTVKAIQMYGINHPSAKNFCVPFYKKLTDFLKNNPELDLQIEQFFILHADEIIHEEKEKESSIAFRLFRNGIRNINFTEGLSYDELLLFLETISQFSREQDIALNLWEHDFTHINFYVVEEEEQILDYKIPEIPVKNIDYDANINEIINKEKIDLNAIMNPDLAFEEFNDLKTEISNTKKLLVVPLGITTLINILKTNKPREVIESLNELVTQCVDNNDFYNARRIVYALKQCPDINPIEKFENETTIIGFQNMINTSSKDIFDEFISFIRFFSKESIPHFINLMVRIKRKNRLLSLRSRIINIARNDPTHFLKYLGSKDAAILINAIALLGLMKFKDTLSLLQPLMFHPNPLVRIEIITALENIGQIAKIAEFLDDGNSDVRLKALQALTKIRYPKIYDNLLRRIKSKDFRDFEFTEQKEYFNCLVASGGKEVIKHLKKILFKWLFFGRKKYTIMRKLAALALVNINSKETREILLHGVKKRDKNIKSACEMALKQK
ncbi:hypothetical protein ES705_21422 [subsurface metagenome]